MLAATAEMLDFAGASAASDHERTGEGELVRAARQGNRAAFGHLHQRYAPMVHGIALARVPPSETGDVVQDVFLHAIRMLHTLRDVEAFGPWLARIARHTAIEFHRSRPSPRSLDSDIEGHAPVALDSGVDEAVRILDVIRALPDAYAETLVLRLVEGMTGPQIAVCTGMTSGSVRVNLHRGMQMLREKLGLEAPT